MSGRPAARPRRLTTCSTPVSVSRPRLPSHSQGSWASARRERDAQVSVQGLAGLVAEGAGPRATALAQHQRHLVVEVDVLQAQPGQLGAAHAGVDEQPEDGAVAAVLERGPGAGVEQPPQLLLAQDRWGSLRHLGRAHGRHRAALDLALVGQPLEELLERAEALRQRGRPHAGLGAVDEEGLDVLAPEVGHSPGAPPARLGEERVELLDRLGVGDDRGRRLVLGPQVAGEGGQVGRERPDRL